MLAAVTATVAELTPDAVTGDGLATDGPDTELLTARHVDAAGTEYLNERKQNLDAAIGEFAGTTAHAHVASDYGTAIAGSPLAGIVGQVGIPTDAAQQRQNLAANAQREGSVQQQTATASVDPAVLQAGGSNVQSTTSQDSVFKSGGSVTGYANGFLAATTGTGDNVGGENAGGENAGTGDNAGAFTNNPTTDGTGNGEDTGIDPRLEWNPFEFPENVVFSEVTLPGETFLDDLLLLTPTGTGSFTDETVTGSGPLVEFTDESLGTGTKTTEWSTTVTLSQQWTSADEWVVTQTWTKTFTTDEESEDDDAVTSEFGRTGTESLSITVINGTRSIVTYSISDRFTHDTGNEWDDSDPDKPGDEDSGHFDAGFEISSSLTMSFEQILVTLPDGRDAITYKLNSASSQFFSAHASGGYGLNKSEGTLVPFSIDATGGGDGGDGEFNADSPEGGDDQTPWDRALSGVEHGGNGSSISASASFSISALSTIDTTFFAEATVPEGETIDDVPVTGNATFDTFNNVNGNVEQSLNLQAQTSGGDTADGTNEHEYISLSFSDSGRGDGTFTFDVDIPFDSSEDDAENPADNGTTGNGTTGNGTMFAMTTPTMTPGDNTTPTSPDEPPHDGPANPLDIGFGVVIEDYGNATSGISYSKREHGVSTNPEYPGYSTYEVGLGSGASGTMESDFEFVTDDNGLPAVEFDIKMNTSGGTSYGGKAFTSTKYIHPGSRLQKTDTIGYGSTFAAESEFTITVGLFSGVDVSGTHNITSNSQEFNGTRLDYLERMLNDDGEFYLIVYRSVDELTLVKELTGDLIDGFVYHEYSIVLKYEFATTIGTPPTPETTPGQKIEFALDTVQTGLDVAGLIPVVGEAADLINVAIHAARGNTGAAVVSLAAAIPFLGGGVTIAKLTNKAGRAMGKHVDKIDNIGHAANDLLTNCKGASCFVAGTQVVVGITRTKSPTPFVDLDKTESGTLLLPPDLPAIAPTEDLDAYYAAGALAMAAALSYRRRKETRRFRRPSV